MSDIAAEPQPAPHGATVARSYRMSQREVLTFVSAVMALMALGIDLMLPAFDDIRVAFDLGEASPRTGQVITVFFLGLAIGQLVYGPLADSFGRKPILYAGLVVYTIGAIGSALAPSFAVLLISRFVWGLGAAGTRVVATSIVRDRFEGAAMAEALSQVMAVFMLVPVFAPALGTGIIALVPWQGVFWFCVVVAGVVGTWGLRMRESLDPAHRRPLDLATTVSGYVEVTRTPVTGGYMLAITFLQGVFTTYLASSELIVSEVFDREEQFPYIFGAVAVFFAIGAIANGRIVGRVGVHRLIGRAFVVITVLNLILVALSIVSDGRPEFWIFMPLLAVTLGCFLLLMPNLNTAAMTPVGHIAGTASALTGSVSMAGGALLGTIVSAQITDSATPFAVGVALLCGAAFTTVLVVRQRSPDATSGDTSF
ncbi:MAG: multidrug effflux MFS transporter [Ilumatobacter sp.]